MPRLSIKISSTIYSTPEAVFATISDFSHYGEWNPWIDNADGLFEVGSRFKAHHVEFGSVDYVITEITPPEKLRWELCSWQRHFIKISREITVFPGQGGETLYTLRVLFRKPVARLIYPLFYRTIQRMLKAEVMALKHYCESQSPTRRMRVTPIRSVDLSGSHEIKK